MLLFPLQVALAPVRALYWAIGPSGMRRLDASVDFVGGAHGKGFLGFARTYACAVRSALAGTAASYQ